MASRQIGVSAEKVVEQSPVQKRRRSILLADLWPPYDLGDFNLRYKRFLDRARPAFSRLLDGILLYDRIVVPTDDFMSLAILTGVLGADSVLDMLENDELRFARLRGSIAYVGNGGGLQSVQIGDEQKKVMAAFSGAEAAIAWALGGLNSKLPIDRFTKLVTNSLVEIEASKVIGELRHETYMDILGSQKLREAFAVRNTDLERLRGVEPNQVRIYAVPGEVPDRHDEIDVVLEIAMANVELRMANSNECEDSSTRNALGHLLRAKIERIYGSQAATDSLLQLFALERIPDVAVAVLSPPPDKRYEPLRQLLKLRRSKEGEIFRQWFHEHCARNPSDVAKHWVELLNTTPLVNTGPMRLLRFFVTTALGSIPGIEGALVGTSASVFDSFLLEKYFAGRAPKIFVDNLRQVGTVQDAETSRTQWASRLKAAVKSLQFWR